MQSVPITTDIVSLNPAKHYAIKFVRSLVYSTNKTDHHDITHILLKVSLNPIIIKLNNGCLAVTGNFIWTTYKTIGTIVKNFLVGVNCWPQSICSHVVCVLAFPCSGVPKGVPFVLCNIMYVNWNNI
jgi:hypothetical protein